MLRLIFLLLFFIPSIAFAKPCTGPDFLGVAKGKPNEIINELDPDSCFGYLDVTFGDPYPNLKKILDSGRIIALRGHMIDGTCIRNNSCPPGAPKYKDFQTLKKRVDKFSAFSKNYPNIKFYVSPFLEHDEKDKRVVNRWYEIVLSVNPNLRHVCSAFTGYCPNPPKVFIEKHGNTRKGDIVSNDGESLFDSSPEYLRNGTLMVLGWVNQMNGRVTGEEGKPPPPKLRINWPTRDILRQVKLILRDPEPAPVIPGCKMIERPELSKTNAEYYGIGKDDGRGNKPLFITKRRYKTIPVFNLEGEKVGFYDHYGSFSGGGERHYMGKWPNGGGSGHNPVQLLDAFGGEWGLARVDNQCWLLNAIRRMGYWR